MIIDMRLRPPIPEFVEEHQSMTSRAISLYTVDQLQLWSNYLGTKISPAALERSLPKFFEEMTDAGIDMGFVHARKSQGVTNERICQLVQEYPDKFIGGINLQPKMEGTESCLQQIEKFVVNGPCKGILLEPVFDRVPWTLNEEFMFPIYEKCSEHNIPVLLTIGGLSLNYASRASLFPALNEVAYNFPNVKYVLCHGGWPAAHDVIQMAAYLGNIYLSIDMYLLNTAYSQAYIDAANQMIPDRILFGTAYPSVDMRDGVEYYKKCGFKEDVLPKVLGENALTVFDGKPIDSLVQRVFR